MLTLDVSISAFLIGGESGIRTLGEFPHTAFRVLHLRPLGQLSVFGFSAFRFYHKTFLCARVKFKMFFPFGAFSVL
jgi:hypothetical protein